MAVFFTLLIEARFLSLNFANPQQSSVVQAQPSTVVQYKHM